MRRKPNPSDLNDDEKEFIESLIPSVREIGYSQTVELRSRWTRTRIWGKINQKLLKTVRNIEGRDEEPSLVTIDSQSVKKNK